jgi:hypothetical protein
VRLARAGCGDVEYWMKLPISEVADYMLELIQQLKDEAQEMERR